LLWLWLGCAIAPGQAPLDPGPRPALSAAEAAEGEKLFAAQCGMCHGTRGDGGRGPSLARPRLRHAPDDVSLYRVVRRGIPGTEMPRSGFGERQIWQVVAFVESLGRIEQPAAPGDAARGKALYASKGNCAQCHTINGRGGATGPDLSEIGARRAVPYLRQSLLEPEAAVPDGFLQVRAAGKDGSRVSGVRLNEDAFSIQVRDFSGNMRSFWKSELAELHKDWGKSSMPNYASILTGAEIDDLVAYLVTLQGAR
jgi:putative heme-binding domain-containing protein